MPPLSPPHPFPLLPLRARLAFRHRHRSLSSISLPSTRRIRSLRPNTLGAWYRRNLDRHPFLLFGLPFIATMVAGSFFLTPATAMRYEKHDRKVRLMSEQERVGIGRDARRVGGDREGVGKEEGGAADRGDGGRKGLEGLRVGKRATSAKEEYYRLAAKDLDDWEQVRVKRWEGEPDGRVK